MGWRTEIKEDGNVEALLERLPIELRTTALTKAVRAAGKVVAERARQLCPPPGYPGDKPGLKPLRDTIGVQVRYYEREQDAAVVAVVGPEYPAGAHGHLVEFGHRIVGNAQLSEGSSQGEAAAGLFSPAEYLRRAHRAGGEVAPQPFLRPAADETEAEQRAALAGTLQKELEKLA